MGQETASDRIKRELQRLLDRMRTDLDRVELLAAVLVMFSRPVPNYEPSFRHLHGKQLSAFELGREFER